MFKENNHNFDDKIEVKDVYNRIKIMPMSEFKDSFETSVQAFKFSDMDIPVYFTSIYKNSVFYREDLEKLHFIKLSSDYPKDLVFKSGKNFYVLDNLGFTGGGIYVSESDRDYFKNLVSKEQATYCFQHSKNGPYFFKVGDEYLESKYSNWFVFLYKIYGYFAKNQLVII